MRMLRESAQLGRYNGSTFDNFKPRAGTEKTLWECKQFANEFPRSLGVLITGQPGNGKSHLAGAICNHLIGQGYNCLFRNVRRLLNSIKASWDSETVSEWQIMSDLRNADLLVLDDLAAYKHTPWREDITCEIIDSRYVQKKPLIVTTNCNLDELQKIIGDRAHDRLIEMCLMVENTADSYREIIAMQRIQDRRKRA